MKYRVRPTLSQWAMILLMGLAAAALLGWLGFELAGAFSTQREDTYSEWVWDLPLWAVLSVIGLQVIVGIAAIGSAWHFIEGWARRRRREREQKGAR